MTLALALLAFGLQVQVPAPTGYVNDFAGVIDDSSRRQMEQLIDEVRAKSGGEIVVVTLKDLGGRASIDVARDIGREWKVGARGGPGDRARNAGVILLLLPGERPGDGKSDLAIATGSGAEGFVTDALSGRIRDAVGRTAVASGSFAPGLVAGVAMLARAYANEFGFDLTGAAPVPEPVAAPRAPIPFPVVLFVAIVLLMLLVRAGRAARGSRWGRSAMWGPVFRSGRDDDWWPGGGRWGGGGGFGGFGGGGGFSGGGASGKF